MIHRNWGLEQVKRHCTCGCGYPTAGEGSSNGRMHSSSSIYILRLKMWSEGGTEIKDVVNAQHMIKCKWQLDMC